MKIQHITKGNAGARTRITAEVLWEDCARPSQEIYFEVDEQFGDALSAGTEAFLAATVMPALWHGERRIVLDDELCPVLRAGVISTMAVIKHWYRLPRDLVQIEAKPRVHPGNRPPDRAAFFLTGGIDSLATLRMNQLNFPSTHPGSFKDGLLIFGLEVDRNEDFKIVSEWLSQLADHTGITLLPVYTNERTLEQDWDFWIDVFEGAVLAAVAHGLTGRLSSATIAASFDIPNLHRVASHPILDPFYSSEQMRIYHDGSALSRFEKIRLLANWDMGLQYIRVCNVTSAYQRDRLNCGQCEKCIRTMLGLLAVGALDKTRAFPGTELSGAVIKERVILHRKNFRFWPELIVPLEQIGRSDLAEAIKYVLERFHGEIGWRGVLTRFDRKHLDGRLSALKQALKPSVRRKPHLGSNGIL
ncbi:MAG: hypothetical protein QOI34_1088 [Verrucomicrobiota bacterium]|jgi:hypothetical protein